MGSNRITDENRLSINNIDLASEWSSKNEWEATVSSRTSGGNGCPKCSKVKLKNGMTFDSKVEAYHYLKLSSKYDKILYNKLYGKGMGNRRYDFYIPFENLYIEVTAFHKGSRNISYISYLRNIVKKRRYVKSIGGKFEFIQKKLTASENKMLEKQCN